jgi:cellulose synthase/poly-beta-1,6-N-acetylglucosamine synthase-like glycosyltransferase
MILLSTSLVLAGLYLYWMTKVLQGWNSYVEATPTKGNNLQGISIVIPFKDEAEHLPLLLQSLADLDYVEDKYEILLVDDSSSDHSVQLVSEWINQTAIQSKLLYSQPPGKKAAQELGVREARYGLIACTDADCVVPNQWLVRINESFHKKYTTLAFGPVHLSGSGYKLQYLEFNALIASTMGMLGLGWAIMGNGANMAFRKDAYLEVTKQLKKKNTPSGDDVFLLHQLAKMGRQPEFIVGRDAMVATLPQPNFKAFFHQRIRWASKAKYYTNRATILIGTLVLLTNMLLLLFLVTSLFLPQALIGFALLFVVKAAADFILLKGHATYFKSPFNFGHFILQEVLNMVYVPLVAVLSQIKSYTWKGRRY